MRVHINGLLPLITSSVVEYPNGDEVVTTLIYERLDKHCTKCLRLDHELKECLVARAEAKAQKAQQIEEPTRMSGSSVHEEASTRHRTVTSTKKNRGLNGQAPTNEVFKFSASPKDNIRDRRAYREPKDNSYRRPYKSQTISWNERSNQRRSHHAREYSRQDFERSARPPRDHAKHRNLPSPPGRSYYREIPKKPVETRITASTASKSTHENTVGGNPPLYLQTPIPQEAFQEAMGELRNVMIQYTKTADPTESEARKERMRQAEEHGEMEETAIQMVRASLAPTIDLMQREQTTLSPERIPASQRLGSKGQLQSSKSGKGIEGSGSSPQDRIPASLRLGPPTEPLLILQDEEDFLQDPLINERIPVTMRLGPSHSPTENVPVNAPNIVKRKPGRPPGAGKNQKKQIPPMAPVPKRRRVPHAKPSPVRKKTTKRAENATTARTKAGPSHGGEHGSSISSENRPICNMIPAAARKRMDFRIHSTPGP